METGLRLLMRDGTLHVLFRPKLTADEYDELLKAVDGPRTIAELREALEKLGKRWGKEVVCDE